MFCKFTIYLRNRSAIAVGSLHFGRKAFATIAGLRSAIQMIGIIVGPIISGYVFDRTGDYKWAFIGLAACGIISFILILLAKPPVKHK